MDKAYVLGVSMTKFAKTPDLKIEEMGAEAVRGALDEAGISPRDAQCVYAGHVMQGTGVGQRIMNRVGFTGMPITNLENACASGSNAFREAYYSVALGRYDICLAIGVENLSGSFSGALTPEEGDLEGMHGLTFPALYALRARRYMEVYGLKEEHLAKIAVKSRKNAYYNEKSTHGSLIDIDTVLSSRMIADPLRLYDCNPVSDGGAAAVIVSEKKARQLGGMPVEIIASSLTSGKSEAGFIDMTYEEMSNRAGTEVYEQSGFGPEDISFVEVHDCFTIAEVLRVEGLGLCKRGEMVKWIEEGVTEITGSKPINPSGGLLGKGHPLGATGIAQIYEVCKQLRGQAGKRQIADTHVGMAMCRGGIVAGIEGSACCVHLLRMP